MNEDQLDEIVEEALAEILTEDVVRGMEAKALRDFIELEVLSPMLAEAMESGEKAMGEWWLLRLTLGPAIKALRLLEYGLDQVAADFLRTFDEVENDIGLPVEVAMALQGGVNRHG